MPQGSVPRRDRARRDRPPPTPHCSALEIRRNIIPIYYLWGQWYEGGGNWFIVEVFVGHISIFPSNSLKPTMSDSKKICPGVHEVLLADIQTEKYIKIHLVTLVHRIIIKKYLKLISYWLWERNVQRMAHKIFT